MVQRGMDLINIKKDGSSLNLIEIHYNRSLCSGQTSLEFTSTDNLQIGNNVQLYIDNSFFGTFYIEEKTIQKDGTIVYRSSDVLKWVRDYFVDDMIEPFPTDTNTSIISKVMDRTGVSYSISGKSVPVGELGSIGMQSALDIVRNMSKMSDLYFYGYLDTVIFKNLSFTPPKYTFNRENTVTLTLSETDSSYRNKVIIWGAYSLWENRWLHWSFKKNTDWEIDNKDVRAVVFSNSGIKTYTNAKEIANSILNIFGNRNIVKTLVFPGVNKDLDISDIVFLDFEEYNSEGMIYSIRIDGDINSGVLTTLILDEICPNILANIRNYERYLYITSDIDGVHRIECNFGGYWEDYNSGLYDKGVRDLKIRRGWKGLVTFSGNTFIRRYGPKWSRLRKHIFPKHTGIDIKRDGKFIVSSASVFQEPVLFSASYIPYSGSTYSGVIKIQNCLTPDIIPHSKILEYNPFKDEYTILKEYSGVYVYDIDILDDRPIISLASFGGFSGNYMNCVETKWNFETISFAGYTNNKRTIGIVYDDGSRFTDKSSISDLDEKYKYRIIGSHFNLPYVRVFGQYQSDNSYLVKVYNFLNSSSYSFRITSSLTRKYMLSKYVKGKWGRIEKLKLSHPRSYVKFQYPYTFIYYGNGIDIGYLGNGIYVIGVVFRTYEVSDKYDDCKDHPNVGVVWYVGLFYVNIYNMDIIDFEAIPAYMYVQDLVVEDPSGCYHWGYNTCLDMAWKAKGKYAYASDLVFTAAIDSNYKYIISIDKILDWNSMIPPPVREPGCNFIDLGNWNRHVVGIGNTVKRYRGSWGGAYYLADGVGFDYSPINGSIYFYVNGSLVGGWTAPSLHTRISTPFECQEMYLKISTFTDSYIINYDALTAGYTIIPYPSGTSLFGYGLTTNGTPTVILTNSGLYKIHWNYIEYMRDVPYISGLVGVFLNKFDYKAGLARGVVRIQSGLYKKNIPVLMDIETGFRIEIEGENLGCNYEYYDDWVGASMSLPPETIDEYIPSTPVQPFSITGYIVADLDDRVYQASTNKLHVETRRPYSLNIWEVVGSFEGNYYSGIYDVRTDLIKENIYVSTLSGLYNKDILIHSGISQAVEICNYTPVYDIIESGIHSIYYGSIDITYNYFTTGNVTSLRIDDMK